MYSKGKAEEILGRLIKGCRDELVITSKVGFSVGDGRVERGLSRRSIMMAIEDTLRRLQTDRIDVYFCHTFDKIAPPLRGRPIDSGTRRGSLRYPLDVTPPTRVVI